MKSKMVITGGGGFCGTHLADHFVDRYQISLFDNFERNALRFAPDLKCNADIEVISGDVLDRDSLRTALSHASIVIHLAAIAGVSNYYERSLATLKVNILGTFNVLEAAVAAGVERLIYFSSSEIYGSIAENVSETAAAVSGPVSERRWVYSVSKLAGEHVVLRYGEAHGLKVSVARPFNVYGPRQIGEGAISNFLRRVTQDEPLEIYGDGTDVRAWCHVSDLVKAIDLMLSSGAAIGKSFNIGNPAARLSTAELAEKIIALYGRGKVQRVPMKHSPIHLRAPDIDLARCALGFEPTVDLDAGLKDTLEWFLRERP